MTEQWPPEPVPDPRRLPDLLEHRCAEARAHAEALCRAIWASDHDRAEEVDWHRTELDRLEHGQ